MLNLNVKSIDLLSKNMAKKMVNFDRKVGLKDIEGIKYDSFKEGLEQLKTKESFYDIKPRKLGGWVVSVYENPEKINQFDEISEKAYKLFAEGKINESCLILKNRKQKSTRLIFNKDGDCLTYLDFCDRPYSKKDSGLVYSIKTSEGKKEAKELGTENVYTYGKYRSYGNSQGYVKKSDKTDKIVNSHIEKPDEYNIESFRIL